MYNPIKRKNKEENSVTDNTETEDDTKIKIEFEEIAELMDKLSKEDSKINDSTETQTKQKLNDNGSRVVTKYYEKDGNEIKVEESVYLKDRKVPFTTVKFNDKGYIKNKITYWNTGKIKKYEPYYFGKLHGLVKEYNFDGKRSKATEYKKGVVEGNEITYNYQNGNVFSQIYYKNGNKNGTAKYFHINGNLKSKTTFKNDLKDGTENIYDEQGKLESTTDYAKGKKHGIEYIYDSKEQLKLKKEYVNGERISEKDYSVQPRKLKKEELKSNNLFEEKLKF